MVATSYGGGGWLPAPQRHMCKQDVALTHCGLSGQQQERNREQELSIFRTFNRILFGEIVEKLT